MVDWVNLYLKIRQITSHRHFYTICSVIAFIYLFYLAFSLRFHKIEYPDETVFDEVYFASFGIKYLRNEFFFDIHPPMAKLTIALVQKWGGFNHTHPSEYKSIGMKYPDHGYVYPRYMMAGLAVLTAMLCFLTVRKLGVSLAGASLSCWLIIHDGLFQVMATKILTDSFLWFFQALSIYLALLFWEHEDAVRSKQNQRAKGKFASGLAMIISQFKDVKWWALCLATGISLGHTACVKWTGVGVIGAIGLLQMWRTFKFLIPKSVHVEAVNADAKKDDDTFLPVTVEQTKADISSPKTLHVVSPFYSKQQNWVGKLARLYDFVINHKNIRQVIAPIILSIKENKATIARGVVGGVTILISLAIFYTMYWVIHMHTLTHFGDGIDFMSKDFKDSLVDNNHPERAVVHMNVFSKILEMHKTMYILNSGITGTHPYGSEWTSWPFVDRGVLFWGRSGTGFAKHIILQGNPIVVYIATACLTIFLLIGAYRIYSNEAVKDITVAVTHTETVSTWDLMMSGGWMFLGYFLNIVPYSRIVRTCYVYHFVPSYYWNLMLIPITIEYLTAGRHLAWRYSIYLIFAWLALSYWNFYSPLYYGDNITPEEFQERRDLTSWP